ncbi:MAG: hypothetical protein JWL76_1537 [Thermoleophilia bacterium]|nr:hypothetical protein [Thermoleophilia bacterium]
MTTVAAQLGHMWSGGSAQLRLGMIQLTQYRASFAIWALSSTLQAVVAMAVWQAVAAANGGTTGGYDASGFAGYFVIALILRELTFTGIVYHLPNRVETGKFAIYLLRPLHPLVQTYGASFANSVQSLVFVIPIAAVLTIAYDATISPSPAAVLATIVVLPFAILARASADSMVAISSFWLVRISGIRGIYAMATLLLGGQFAPLAVLPDWLATIARALPFYWALGFPIELLVGRADASEAITAVAVLAAWSIGLLLVLQPAWRAGTRAYEAVGQ